MAGDDFNNDRQLLKGSCLSSMFAMNLSFLVIQSKQTAPLIPILSLLSFLFLISFGFNFLALILYFYRSLYFGFLLRISFWQAGFALFQRQGLRFTFFDIKEDASTLIILKKQKSHFFSDTTFRRSFSKQRGVKAHTD